MRKLLGVMREHEINQVKKYISFPKIMKNMPSNRLLLDFCIFASSDLFNTNFAKRVFPEFQKTYRMKVIKISTECDFTR